MSESLGLVQLHPERCSFHQKTHASSEESKLSWQLRLPSRTASTEQLAPQEIVPESASHCAAKSQEIFAEASDVSVSLCSTQTLKLLFRKQMICRLRYLVSSLMLSLGRSLTV